MRSLSNKGCQLSSAKNLRRTIEKRRNKLAKIIMLGAAPENQPAVFYKKSDNSKEKVLSPDFLVSSFRFQVGFVFKLGLET